MKLLHVTIQTKRFDEEIDFYRDHAGLDIIRDMRDRGMDIVFLGDGEEDTQIEIIKRNDADEISDKDISIGFATEDVDKKREELVEAGFAVTDIISPAPGVRFFFVTDPAGLKVQFM